MSFGWPSAYLLWMGRRRTGLVCFACLVSCLRMAGASSVIYFGSLSVGLWLGCRSFVFFWLLCWWDFYSVCWDYVFYLVMYLWCMWHDYAMENLFNCFLDVMRLFQCEFWKIIYACFEICWRSNIYSWIFVLSACFIALED